MSIVGVGVWPFQGSSDLNNGINRSLDCPVNYSIARQLDLRMDFINHTYPMVIQLSYRQSPCSIVNH